MTHVTSSGHLADRPLSPGLVSWGAVFAGLVLSLAVYLILSTLGTAIGATAIDPMEAGNPFRGFGVGAGIWAGLTTLVALAVGGFFAGYLSRRSGALHGLLAWAVTTLVTAYLLISATGAVIGAAGSTARAGLGAIGAGVGAAAPALGDTLRRELDEAGVSLDMRGLRDELEQMLRQTGKAELQPERLREQAETAAREGESRVERAAEHPRAAGDELRTWWSRVSQRAGQALDAADKDALVNLIAARTGKPREEAQRIADDYERLYNEAMQRYQQAKVEAEHKAREAGAAAAAGIAKTSWSTLAVLLIGALVAAGAGAMGQRRQYRDPAYREVKTA